MKLSQNQNELLNLTIKLNLKIEEYKKYNRKINALRETLNKDGASPKNSEIIIQIVELNKNLEKIKTEIFSINKKLDKYM